MDFPSREEARVYMMLQGRSEDPPDPLTAPPADPPAAPAEKSYRVDKKGFENDVYDRRAMRDLIRSGGIAESDPVVIGSEAARRAGDFPELKSLFELKKSSRADPPAVCRKHTDLVAHYLCTDTGRPLCEACAAEKKFGGASVRVCDHCGGTAAEIPMES